MLIVRHTLTSWRASNAIPANSIATSVCSCTGHVSWPATAGIDEGDEDNDAAVAVQSLHAVIHACMPCRMNNARPKA
jgi:hypothetical protein